MTLRAKAEGRRPAGLEQVRRGSAVEQFVEAVKADGSGGFLDNMLRQ